jgi:hypothetical protein
VLPAVHTECASMALVEYSDDEGSDSSTASKVVLQLGAHAKQSEACVSGVKRKRAEGAPAIGTWPTIVFLPVDSSASLTSAATQYAEVVERLYGVETQPLGTDDAFGFHVSLSRNLQLRMPEIDPFIKRVQDACAGVKPFTMSLEGCQLFPNDDGSKTFLGLLLGVGQRDVVTLIRRIDSVLKELGKQTYYEVRRCILVKQNCTPPPKRSYLQPPDPHVSTAFFTPAVPTAVGASGEAGCTTESRTSASNPLLPTSFSAADLASGGDVPHVCVEVTCIMVKVGIRTYKIDLHT